MAQSITCNNFVFYNDFDSANLAKVEPIKHTDNVDHDTYESGIKSCKITDDLPDYEFNVWTKHDCHGTEFQNNNRTWFYFGIKSPVHGVCVKLNVVNLNRQSKMFSQGMCPVFKIIPGHPHWERIRDKPTYTMDQKGSEFTLSFIFRTPENPKAIIYVAFTYPFTYTDLQYYLNKIDIRMSKQNFSNADAIYYHRECAIKSLEGRRLDVLTISSHHNISIEREAKLMGMFPDCDEERPFKFCGKRVIFVSARVHPGETPSSFVFNGFLNFIINHDDPIAIILRRIYVFKLIPMLNPDGVARGHYRMDTRGINLNRVYLNPSINDHPTIFAARSLIRYYHNFYEYLDEVQPQIQSDSVTLELNKRDIGLVTDITLDKGKYYQTSDPMCSGSSNKDIHLLSSQCKNDIQSETTLECNDDTCSKNTCTAIDIGKNSEDSGLFLYIDLHGHASKKGVFMYGNYFDDPDDTIACMLLPKLMSINNPNFHFTSCNFAERNMYLIDKRDGMSREGSGRVAVYKLTGLVRCYTLECNYNSGRLVNSLPSRVRDNVTKSSGHMFIPPKYTPTLFEEVGASLGPSILDLTNSNPNSRLPNSQYRSLRGVKSYLKLTYVNNIAGNINRPRLKPLSSHENIGSLSASNCIEDIVTAMSNMPSDETTRNSQKTDVETKSLIVRRTSSLYSGVKRMKSGKRCQRQLPINRKSMKNHRRINNVENGTIISKIRSSQHGVKTMLKPIGQFTSNNNLRKIIVENHHGKNTTCVDIITQRASIIKRGTKRLKFVSQQRLLKIKPEIGESSKPSLNTIDRSSQKTVRVGITRDKRVKVTFTKLKKPEQMKPRMPSSKHNTKI